MKTTLALAFLAAAALQAFAAPTLRDGPAPGDESSVPADRQKKSYYGTAPHTPCAAAAGLNAGLGGYGAGVGASSFGHGAPLPSVHAAPQIGLGGFGGYGGYGGYGVQPSMGFGYGGGAQHYRASELEQLQDPQEGASENREQTTLMTSDAEKATLAQIEPEQAPEHPLARSSYDGGYGSGLAIGSGAYGPGLAIGSGSYGPGLAIGSGSYGPGLAFGSAGYGSGLALGGGIASLGRPIGGPSVGVFPGGLGGCGAIPLLLSCSPNLVQGHLVQTPHRHVYSGGYGYGGGAHSLYRASDAANEKGTAEQQIEQHHQATQQAAQQAAHQAAQQAAQQKSQQVSQLAPHQAAQQQLAPNPTTQVKQQGTHADKVVA